MSDDHLDDVTFDRLLERNDPFNGGTLCFDLTGYTFVAPAAMASLAALLSHLARDGRNARVLCPDPTVHGYLCRAGFFGVAETIATIEPPMTPYARIYSAVRGGSNPLVLELTTLQNGAALPNRLDQIVSVLRHRFQYAKPDAFDAAIAISEVCQNTFDHNSNACGFLAMQVYGRGAKRFLQIGIADYGDGIATSLARNPAHRGLTDLDAIHRATDLGTSEHDDPTRGTGLHHLLDIAYRQKGSVQIRSGTSKVRYRFDQQKAWDLPARRVPGVHIALSLRARQKGS